MRITAATATTMPTMSATLVPPEPLVVEDVAEVPVNGGTDSTTPWSCCCSAAAEGACNSANSDEDTDTALP